MSKNGAQHALIWK